MARRNHLFLFAWLCATVVPAGLQIISGTMDEIRSYLAYYYGELTLYMFFIMTYSFATVFIAFYVTSGFRRSGSLDLLRVSAVRPWEVAAGIQLELQKILLPPLALFSVAFLVYAGLGRQDSFISGQSWWLLGGMVVLLWFNFTVLTLITSLGLFRREAPWALLASVLVLPFNALPVLLLYVLKLPPWLYALMMLALLAVLALVNVGAVARLWPPQAAGRRRV